MSVSVATDRWLIQADLDRTAATVLTQQVGGEVADIICFHCQQAAEKYVKAVLIQARVDFPKTHDIEQLLDLACQNGHDIRELMSGVDLLMPFAVDVRYPGTATDDKSMHAALDEMDRFRRVCLHTLGIVEPKES